MQPYPLSFNESSAAQTLRQGFPWLRFPEPLETEFQRDHQEANRRLARIGLLVAFLISTGFAAIDYALLPPADYALPNVMRYGLQFPAVLLVWLTTLGRAYMSWYQNACQIGVAVFGASAVFALSGYDSSLFSLMASRLMLVTLYAYFMTGLRLQQALRSNALIFLAVLWIGFQSPIGAAIHLAFAFICANIIGGVGAYALEHASRTAFLDRLILQDMASRDGLTQLLNRQTFDWRAAHSWRRRRDSEPSAGVLMIDVDYFKMYNDRYGHQAGDVCLQRIAVAVHAAIGAREHDLVGRYGGEELIAIVFDRSAEQLQDIALRIVVQVQALSIAHADSLTGECVSVSVGAAHCQSPLPLEHGALVRLADKALYAAKHQGRNRAVAFATSGAGDFDHDADAEPIDFSTTARMRASARPAFIKSAS